MSDLFKEKAKDWDVSDRIRQMSLAIGGAIASNVDLSEQMQVLDFGAGTGLIASQVAPKVQKITAVDISESMLEKLRAKADIKDKVEIICQDITVNPLGRQFDCIMSAMAMHHVKDTDNMVKQFSAHLKSGGKIALADLDSEDGTFHPKDVEGVYHFGFDRAEFEQTLKKYGFKDIRFVTAHTMHSENGAYPIFLALGTKG